MRVLFTCLPQSGHFNPLVPTARALRDAGHEVVFACPTGFAPTIEAASFPTFPAGFEERGQSSPELFPDALRLPQPERAVWSGVQPFRRGLRSGDGGQSARRLPYLATRSDRARHRGVRRLRRRRSTGTAPRQHRAANATRKTRRRETPSPRLNLCWWRQSGAEVCAKGYRKGPPKTVSATIVLPVAGTRRCVRCQHPDAIGGARKCRAKVGS